ncbi:MAG: hypothetical protein MUC65_03930 [Pontiellaceae bacterium]|nr:hypothetical protein [Pontiellaceae bacterium]
MKNHMLLAVAIGVSGLCVCTATGISTGASNDYPVIDQMAAQQVGRGEVTWLDKQTVRIKDAYLLVNNTNLTDFTFSFEGRAPADAGAEEVGIWATFRQFDRNHRYVAGLRGAPHSDLYLARYSPDGNDRMLALQPVPTVAPGEWAAVKIAASGSTIKVYLNGVERVSVDDPNASFTAGKVGVGGGYHASEYRSICIKNGVPVESLAFADGAVKINFQRETDPVPEGWKADSGGIYTVERGYGWTEDRHSRMRNRDTTGQFLSDTLIAISHDDGDSEFKLDLNPGDYQITLQHGDDWPGNVSVLDMTYCEDAPPLKDTTERGVRRRLHTNVTVGDKGLSLLFHRKPGEESPAFCLNWLVVEPRGKLTKAQWAKGSGDPNAPRDNPVLRKQQRAAYVPQKIDSIEAGRTEVSLDGDWLFLPDYEFKKTEAPQAVDAMDDEWHVMPVPALWSPYAAWLFGETFPNIPYDKGAGDSYYEYRHARVEAFTFDWEKTKSAWYRKHIVLPEIPDGKRFELCFDAIAKVSHIYVNGTYVGKNHGMFGDIKFDVTAYLKPGTNVIAVKVDQERDDIKNGDEIVDVAISVEVTRKMLSALPYGMTRQDARGIWQPTKLVITDAARVTDIFVKPSLNGADVEVTLKNMSDAPVMLTPYLSVVSEMDGAELVQFAGSETTVPAGESKVVALSFSAGSPRLWSPADPQLYTFNVSLRAGGKVVDKVSVVSGFKTFEAHGSRLLLNGKPYALRGANHCPNMLAPNDGALADRFMKIMRENNLNATRFHAMPGTEPWMAAADRNGVLISYEGTWPWLMLKGPIPPQESLDIWMDEFQRIIKKYRNHPSLMLWTVNNEMKFHVFYAHSAPEEKTPEAEADILARAKVVSKAVKMVRETDPTRPVVADSGYVRGKYWRLKQTPEGLGLDDGDIDDEHAYCNWYNASFFNLPDKPLSGFSPSRPFISQEMSTGYYNGDSGHPVRAYLFAHQTPQSWVGQWAYEHRNPSIFMNRHAMLTKELAEYYRREHREDWAGTLIFGLATWFKNQWDAEKIAPYPVVTDSLRNAMSPVLVSARLTGRNLFAGDIFTAPVSIINDAENGAAFPAGKLTWRFVVNGEALSEGLLSTPAVAYYSNQKMEVKLKVPSDISEGRADAQLCFDLSIGGKIVSSNHYAVTIGSKEWAVEPVQSSKGTAVVCNASPGLKALCDKMGLKIKECRDLKGLKLKPEDRLVIDGNIDPSQTDALRSIIAEGVGSVVWINARTQAEEFFPEQILNYRRQEGEAVTMLLPESPVFAGIQIGDLSWLGGPSVKRVPVSSSGGYYVAWKNPNLAVLAEEMNAHGYLDKPTDKLTYWVTPLVAIQQAGSTPVILSEMSIDTALTDPVALRLWANLLSGKTHLIYAILH